MKNILITFTDNEYKDIKAFCKENDLILEDFVNKCVVNLIKKI